MDLRGRKRKYHDFSQDLLDRAIEDITNNHLSVRQAEKKYNIAKSTLNRWVNSKQTRKYGRPPVFSSVEEAHISECLSLAAKWGFPLTSENLKDIVKKVLDSKGIREDRFVDNRPGKKWIKKFLARQSETLKTRISHNIKRARAAVSPEVIHQYFDELNDSLKDIPPEALINYDETSIQDNPGKAKVIVRRTCKHPEKINDTSKSAYSVMFAGTASGVTLPVYIVYKSPSNLYHTWTEGGPKGARYNRSKSGWFEGPLFEDWFITIAVPYLRKLGNGPKAVIGDNLASHISVSVLQLCIEHNIRFILLPPNSTHLCQPLDLAYFSPLKTAWRKVLQDFKNKHRGAITKDIFPRKLKQALNIIQEHSENNLKSGFKASGIYPLDCQQVLKRLPGKENINEETWTNSFEDFLKSTRKSETETVRKRKTRVHTIPGKSLSEAEIIEELRQKEEAKQIPKPQKQKIRKSNKKIAKRMQKTVYDLSDSDSCEDGQLSLHDTNSDMDPEDFSNIEIDFHENVEIETEPDNNIENFENDNIDTDYINLKSTEIEKVEMKNVENETIDLQTDKISLTEGDFVLVNLIYNEGTKKQSTKRFAGKFVRSENGRVLIDFLRNYQTYNNMFVFPNVEDRMFINETQIIKKLELVSTTRNVLKFKM